MHYPGKRPERELTEGSQALLVAVEAVAPYEYVLLVTTTDWDLVGLARLSSVDAPVLTGCGERQAGTARAPPQV